MRRVLVLFPICGRFCPSVSRRVALWLGEQVQSELERRQQAHLERAGVRSAGNPHAAYDVAEVGGGVKGRIEAPEHGESLRLTATPRPCGHRASFRPYLRGGGGSDATSLTGGNPIPP